MTKHTPAPRIGRTRLRIKCVYDSASPSDGLRVLVDRLWPRGLSKERAKVDLWLKDLAPSSELRRWFGHRPDRWPEFQRRYGHELNRKSDQLRELHEALRRGPVTLLFAAHDVEHNNALVLKSALERS